MRLAISSPLFVVLGFFGFASAEGIDLGVRQPDRPPAHEAYTGGGRVGGDALGDAVIISSLPFTDTGNTCGYANDYDEVCPYTGSTAPDVVYRYLPAADLTIEVDLCSSSYDTKVFVYEDGAGTPIACNDDAGCGYSGFQSRTLPIMLDGGHTYYIVVDGWGTSCGDYALEVRDRPPCELVCPPGAQLEGEPPCVDDYIDVYNGGCAATGWTPVDPQTGESAVVCARSCTYRFDGFNYRDTDWYRLNSAGGWLTVRGTGEFPIRVILIYGTQCNDLQHVYEDAPYCETAEVSWFCPPDQMVWLYVAPSVFDGVPEADYLLDISGIHSTLLSWGACCDPQTGGCTVLQQQDCEGYWNIWYDCDPNPCDITGACCLLDGSCVARTLTSCTALGGAWHGFYSYCSPNPCPHACCAADGECQVVTERECETLQGAWLADQIICLPNPCGGACCLAAGGCEIVLGSESCEGDWLGFESVCEPDPCWLLFGACCFADGTCEIQTIATCTATGGTWMGVGVNCIPGETCPPPTPVERMSWGQVKKRFR